MHSFDLDFIFEQCTMCETIMKCYKKDFAINQINQINVSDKWYMFKKKYKNTKIE